MGGLGTDRRHVISIELVVIKDLVEVAIKRHQCHQTLQAQDGGRIQVRNAGVPPAA
jgi:hypothetical protein